MLRWLKSVTHFDIYICKATIWYAITSTVRFLSVCASVHKYTQICVAGWILFCSNIARAQKPQYTKAKIVWNPFGRTKIPIVQLKCVYIEFYSGSCLFVVVFVVEMELMLRFYVRLWFSTKRLADSPGKKTEMHTSHSHSFLCSSNFIIIFHFRNWVSEMKFTFITYFHVRQLSMVCTRTF